MPYKTRVERQRDEWMTLLATVEHKRPQLSDFRESGSIEQGADVVMFLFRQSYYLERSQPTRMLGEGDRPYTDRLADWHNDCRQEEHRAEVIVAKNRHGSTGTVPLHCDMALGRFRNLAPNTDRGR